jgi:hypothetical protein
VVFLGSHETLAHEEADDFANIVTVMVSLGSVSDWHMVKVICFLHCLVRTTCMKNISAEDQGVTRLELDGDGLFVLGCAFRIPQMGSRNDQGRAVLGRGLGHGDQKTQHAGIKARGEVIVAVKWLAGQHAFENLPS